MPSHQKKFGYRTEDASSAFVNRVRIVDTEMKRTAAILQMEDLMWVPIPELFGPKFPTGKRFAVRKEAIEFVLAETRLAP